MSRLDCKTVVGLMPAAGYATRLGKMPCSKEILPLGWFGGKYIPDTALADQPRAVLCSAMLTSMRLAGIDPVYIILRPGKWDIPAYLEDGASFGLSLAYLVRRYPYGVPFTLDSAFPFVRDRLVALAFPDILFGPEDALARLLFRLREGGADVVLGLFPCSEPDHVDTVEADASGEVTRIEIKQPDSEYRYAWILAVWTPVFSAFLHAYVEGEILDGREPISEVYMGHVFQAWLGEGRSIQSVSFQDGWFRDLGSRGDEQKSQDE